MIKKALIASAIALATGAFVFGTSFRSYVRTTAGSVRDAVKGEVPIEFEVKRAQDLVEHLIPDIHRCMHTIAEQEVEIDHLGRGIEQKTAQLERQKEAILSLRGDLGSGKDTYRFAGLTYTSDDVKRDLSSRLERYKSAEATLERDRQILRAHQETLKANQRKLDEMISAKRDLEVQIAQLEARLRTLQAAEAASTLEFDDSQLAQAKKLINELNKQLDVREKMLDAEGRFPGLIPVDADDEIPAVDVIEQVDAHFGPTEMAPVLSQKPAA